MFLVISFKLNFNLNKICKTHLWSVDFEQDLRKEVVYRKTALAGCRWTSFLLFFLFATHIFSFLCKWSFLFFAAYPFLFFAANHIFVFATRLFFSLQLMLICKVQSGVKLQEVNKFSFQLLVIGKQQIFVFFSVPKFSACYFQLQYQWNQISLTISSFYTTNHCSFHFN